MNAQLQESENYRCFVNAKGKTSVVVLTGRCIGATINKHYSHATDRPLIQVLGPVGQPDFVADSTIPF
jgi:hypothetical protein